MLEAAIVDLVSPSAWSAAPLILSYPQAARPITPSFGAKRTLAEWPLWVDCVEKVLLEAVL